MILLSQMVLCTNSQFTVVIMITVMYCCHHDHSDVLGINMLYGSQSRICPLGNQYEELAQHQIFVLLALSSQIKLSMN